MGTEEKGPRGKEKSASCNKIKRLLTEAGSWIPFYLALHHQCGEAKGRKRSRDEALRAIDLSRNNLLLPSGC